MQGSRLYVGNLSYNVTSDQLQQLFAGYGQVKSADVIEGKGFGFVEMSTPGEAQQAKDALDGQEFNGRNLKVDEAKPPRDRQDRERPRGGPGR
jgi:RNA recognition motif-containing protein